MWSDMLAERAVHCLARDMRACVLSTGGNRGAGPFSAVLDDDAEVEQRERQAADFADDLLREALDVDDDGGEDEEERRPSKLLHAALYGLRKEADEVAAAAGGGGGNDPPAAPAFGTEAKVDVESLPGTAILRAVRDQLFRFDWKPGPNQQEFLDECIATYLPRIFNHRRPGADLTDWQRYERQIKDHFYASKQLSVLGVVCSMPRQFGKTTALAMFVASMVAHVPGFRVIVLSINQRIAMMVGEDIWRFLRQIPGVRHRLKAKNTEKIVLRPAATNHGGEGPGAAQTGAQWTAERGTDAYESIAFPVLTSGARSRVFEILGAPVNTDEAGYAFDDAADAAVADEDEEDDVVGSKAISSADSSVHVLPSGSDRHRGLKADGVVIDEGAFVDAATFQVILPIIRVDGRRAIIISSPAADSDSIFTKLMQESVDGTGERPAFVGVKYSLKCDECAAKNASTCPHRPAYSPPWENPLQRAAIEKIIRRVDPASAARELDGAFIDSNMPVFDPRTIQSLFNAENYWTPRMLDVRASDSTRIPSNWVPPVVFIGIDPSGGGDGSNTAIVSFFFVEAHHHLVVSVCLIACLCACVCVAAAATVVTADVFGASVRRSCSQLCTPCASPTPTRTMLGTRAPGARRFVDFWPEARR